MRAAASEDDETLKQMTNEAMGVVMGSEDLKEGLTAFIEKRASAVEGTLTANGHSRRDTVIRRAVIPARS